MNPEIRTMQGVYQLVKTKTTHQKQLAQKRALIQSRTRRSPISKLSPKTNDMNINDIVAKTITAAQNRQEARPQRDKNQPRAKKSLRVLNQATFRLNQIPGGVGRIATRSKITRSSTRCSKRMVAPGQRG